MEITSSPPSYLGAEWWKTSFWRKMLAVAPVDPEEQASLDALFDSNIEEKSHSSDEQSSNANDDNSLPEPVSSTMSLSAQVVKEHDFFMRSRFLFCNDESDEFKVILKDLYTKEKLYMLAARGDWTVLSSTQSTSKIYLVFSNLIEQTAFQTFSIAYKRKSVTDWKVAAEEGDFHKITLEDSSEEKQNTYICLARGTLQYLVCNNDMKNTILTNLQTCKQQNRTFYRFNPLASTNGFRPFKRGECTVMNQEGEIRWTEQYSNVIRNCLYCGDSERCTELSDQVWTSKDTIENLRLVAGMNMDNEGFFNTLNLMRSILYDCTSLTSFGNVYFCPNTTCEVPSSTSCRCFLHQSTKVMHNSRQLSIDNQCKNITNYGVIRRGNKKSKAVARKTLNRSAKQ